MCVVAEVYEHTMGQLNEHACMSTVHFHRACCGYMFAGACARGTCVWYAHEGRLFLSLLCMVAVLNISLMLRVRCCYVM